LVYNITYIERADSLKENGRTVYPTDLYKAGKWTWSAFEDYLNKLNNYYRNVSAPVRPEERIKPYQTDFRYAAVSAVHSAGSAFQGPNGFEYDSPTAVRAVSFLEDLWAKGLGSSILSNPESSTSVFVNAVLEAFQNGESVFLDCQRYWPNLVSAALAARGESMGIVPWPRPDDMPFNDPRYHQPNSVNDTFCALKGVSDEQTRLALQAFKIFWETYYKAKGNTAEAGGFLKASGEVNAAHDGYDIMHPVIGRDLLDLFVNYSPPQANEFSEMTSTFWAIGNIIGESIYQFNGAPRYAVNVAQKTSVINESVADIQRIIASGTVNDNIQPSIANPRLITLRRGTNPAQVDFASYVTVTDNIDGTIDSKAASYDYASIAFNTAGIYEGPRGLHVAVTDSYGNEQRSDLKVVIYDGDSRTAPTLRAKAALPDVRVNTDAATIDWKNFIDTALDKDGLDLKDNLSADVSNLDVTRIGTYDVPLTVTDFAGNKTSLTLRVRITG
jgi:hypothetical protein